MKYKKITIETDGTSAGTTLAVDGNMVGLVQRLDFSADNDSVFAMINVQVARQKNGKVNVKKIKVRDSKTEKFLTKDEIDRVALSLERDV